MRLVSALFAAAVALMVDPATARDLKLSHQWPADTDARDRAARLFAQEVQLRAPGISVRIYPQLSLKIGAEEQFDALQSGSLELSVYPLPYAVKKVPEFSLAVLPGLYPSLDTVRDLRGSKVIEHLQTIAHRNGVHILGWWWVPGGFVTKNREIAGPDTVKGLKLRSGDHFFDVMLKKAGATPVTLPSNEIYAAIASGKIDGALTSYETFVSTKIYEHGKYFTAGSPGIWMFLTALIMSNSVWESLSDAERDALTAAAEISEDYFLATQRDAERRFIETFTKAGAKYRKFTREDYMAWLQLAQESAWAEYLTISPAAKTMLYDTIEAVLDSTQ
jgi:TRAP-type C4-dicarboxylate transport system substrate-binding protein